MTAPLRIGTRGSPLALWQARHVADRLRQVALQQSIEFVEIQTAGDQVRDVPLAQLGGEGVFTKAIQQALQAGAIDMAVHSLKDLPTFSVPNLILAAVPPRGPTEDVLVCRSPSFASLPKGAVLATSSLRRQAQLLHRRPDLRLVNIRGNVETRLRKLTEGDLDGVVLAQAGLERLGLAAHITEVLDSEWMLPAVGQGALGLECRNDDLSTRTLLEKINDPAAKQAVLAERAMLRRLGGGCHMPIGAATAVSGIELMLRGAVLSADGKQRLEGRLAGPVARAEELGRQLAADLLARGADKLLSSG
jgi:hydroxymethylbilane synthase